MRKSKFYQLIFGFLFSIIFFSCGMETPQQKDAIPAEKLEKEVNAFMNEWHEDAANARPAFFDKIAENGIYIGTDKTERWEKSEFQSWSKQFFDRGEAWDFKTIERNINFSEDGNYAWFDELLDTWMGVCRSTGVLHKTADGWEIEHYQLSVTVPNEIVNEFVELVKTKS